jgi:hypothetical protein
VVVLEPPVPAPVVVVEVVDEVAIWSASHDAALLSAMHPLQTPLALRWCR